VGTAASDPWHRLEEGCDLVFVIAEQLAQLDAHLGRNLFANKIAVQLTGDEFCSDRLGQNDVNHLHTIKLALTTEHGFDTVIMLRRVDHEIQTL